ncbi:ATP-binding protein [Xanthobacter tagetidis]|uniref:ATP-binding protein n=1 Tax=Xanthobacter tagetidis TaxID=60216 RepID=A0A3L6ZXK0_9HYPH|nr:ATP-binding protein [Xanthobacter tagetidis]MBB6310252.1 anti-sigma regulatory factor (Ser/Thr protein kinase) [Xanthobacter tagetidis]RLP72639.1 ATP-binding protein [Xanthobacter tagetidis]
MIPPSAAGSLLSELRIGARIDEIAVATSWLGDLADAGDWPQSTRFGLELSLEEALTNVISYGFAGLAHDPDIRIECWRTPQDRIVVRIRDNGVAFDPTTIAAPDVPASIEEAKIGGHGVQLMRNFLESLSYERADGENRLTLVGKPDQD